MPPKGYIFILGCFLEACWSSLYYLRKEIFFMEIYISLSSYFSEFIRSKNHWKVNFQLACINCSIHVEDDGSNSEIIDFEIKLFLFQ